MKTRLFVAVIFVFAQLAFSNCTHAGSLVAAWGDNAYRQTALTLPVGVNHVKTIAAGESHCLAVKSDGTVIAWGDNDYGCTDVPAKLSNVIAVAGGEDFSLALQADGTIVGWGADWQGELDIPIGLSNVIAIAAAGSHCLALKADGTVVSWGYNGYGGVPAGLSNVVAIAAGGWHSLALKSDGTVVGWGADGAGQADAPAGLSNVVAIAAGETHSLALTSDGMVVAWGFNGDGQTDVPSGLSNVAAIAAGCDESLALKSDGTVVAWGQLSNVPRNLTKVTAIAAGGSYGAGSFCLAATFGGPVQITQNPEPRDPGLAYGSNVTFTVSANGNGPLSYQWFLNGQALATNSRISGVTNASLTISNLQISDMGTYTVVVSNALGSVVSAGTALTVISPPFITGAFTTNLIVGAGTNVMLSAPVQGTPPLSYQWQLNGTNLAVGTTATLQLINVQPGASGIYSLLVTNAYGRKQIDFTLTVTNSPPYILKQPTGGSVPVGGGFAFMVSAHGSLPLHYQWRFNGQNISGATNATLSLRNLTYNQTGYYDAAVSNPYGRVVSAKVLLSVGQTSVQVWSLYANPYVPTNVPPGLTNAVAIAAGSYHVLVLKRDGTVATWAGSGLYSPAVTNIPPSVHNVVAIAAGSDGSFSSSMALKANGNVVVWGDNFNGITNVPPTATNVVAIANGGDHCLALRADGTVVGWGYNAFGQSTAPVGLSNVVSVAAGAFYSLALKLDGTIVAWGENVNIPAITNVPPDLSHVIAIAAATVNYGSESMALNADGTVTNWGFPNVKLSRNATNVVAIAAGPGSEAALKSDGTVVWSAAGGAFKTDSNIVAIASGGSSSPGFVAAIVGDGTPFITLQPVSQTATSGTTVELHARAVGAQPWFYNQRQQKASQPLSCQWQFNGINLPGATNFDLILTNITAQNAGRYQAVVTNYLGVATSKVGQLTVVSAPYSGSLAAALNATNLVWPTNPTNAPWFGETSITHDGEAAAQSGYITDNRQSILQTTVAGPGTLSFWWKVSSEEGYDFLNFYLDNTNALPLANISGETEWQPYSLIIPSGTHTLFWIYAKDYSVNAGQDAGWLDQVTFTPGPPLMLSAPRRLSDGAFLFSAGATNGMALASDALAGLAVQASTDLVNWLVLTNSLTLTNGVLQWRDSAGSNYPSRFYRVIKR